MSFHSQYEMTSSRIRYPEAALSALKASSTTSSTLGSSGSYSSGSQIVMQIASSLSFWQTLRQPEARGSEVPVVAEVWTLAISSVAPLWHGTYQ